MEIGLKDLAKKLGIPYAPSWESYITPIKKQIERDWKDKEPEWKSDEAFYKEVIGDLEAVKLAWRNTTMHIVRHYGPDDATQVFNAVQVFMNRLASKFAPLQNSATIGRMRPSPEFEAFDKLVGKVLSVSHDEIKRREEEYKKRTEANPRKRVPKRKIKCASKAHAASS
jgi:hypothetical protein